MSIKNQKEVLGEIQKILINAKKDINTSNNNTGKEVVDALKHVLPFLIDEVKTEKERKEMIEKIGQDLKESLRPLFEEIVKKTTIQRQDIIDAVKSIKVEAPKVNVEAKAPDVNIPPIRIPSINVPKPEVKVEVPKIEMPKEMKVKGIEELNKLLTKFLEKEPEVNDNPIPAMLVDEKGMPYKASTGSISVGGGGGGVVTVRKATGSKISEVSLTNVANWYSYEIPDNTVALDMFLTVQGYTSYYCWDSPGSARIPIFGGYSRHIDGISFNKKIIYFTCPTANQTMVVEAFLGD